MNFLPKSFEIPSLIVLGLSFGASAGFIVHNSLKPTLFTVDGDAGAFLMDHEAAFEKYEKVKAKGGDFVKELEPCELVSVAYTRLGKIEYSIAEGIGSSKAMGLVDQSIQSRSIRNKDEYFEESNSFSQFVKIYNRMYEKGDETTKYWGNSSSYQGYTPEVVSNADYAKLMGRQVSESLIYVVSPKTTGEKDLSGQGLTKVEKNADGNIVVNFEADPASATLKYVRQMKTISDLKEYPSFEYVHLSFTMTPELDILYMKSWEKYQATLSSGIGSACEGTMTICYKGLTPEEATLPKPSDPSLPYPGNQDELLAKYGYNAK